MLDGKGWERFSWVGVCQLDNWSHLNPILRLVPPKLGFQVQI